jgi:hypothetical protein
MKRIQVHALALLLPLLAGTSMADTSGTIRGTVSDTSGAVLPSAQVSASNEQTGEIRRVNADAYGSFELLLLPVGTYTLRVEHPGFHTSVLTRIQLSVNQVATFDLRLKPGGTEVVVNVEEHAVQVDTATSQLGTVIDSKPIVDLPLNGRNVYQLIALQPGIAVTNKDNGNPALLGTGTDGNAPVPLAFSSGGGRVTMNNFMVDGADTNNAFLNQAGVEIIPDAVEEFRVITNTFNAEFGRNSGSIVNIITKSGSNKWHGDLFEFLRNDKLNASNFFERTNKATYKLNQFGGTLGGPIVQNKTFVFGSAQISRERRGAPGTTKTVFSDAQRAGDFSTDPELVNNQDNPGEFPGVLSNDLCLPQGSANCFPANTPYSMIFPGGQIPLSSFDPLALDLINKFISRQNSGTGSFVSTPVQPNDSYQWTVKVDQQLTANQKLSIFYYFDDTRSQQQLPGVGLPGFPVDSKIRAQNLSIRDLWLANPRSINEFEIGYLGTAQNTRPNNGQPPSSYGFTGIHTPPPVSDHSLPSMVIGASLALGGNGGGSGDFQNTYQVVDNFSKLAGSHAIKFGGDYRLIKYVQRFSSGDGSFFFSPAGSNSTGDSFADFALGLASEYDQDSGARQSLHSHQLDLFAQDTWRIRPTLTLSYGLRWELNTPYVDANNEFNFIQAPAPGQAPAQSKTFPTAPPGYLFAGDPGVARGIARPQYRNFSPRIGLAFSPSWFGPGKLVIRSAYGMFYNPIEQFVYLQFNGEPPFAAASFVPDPGFATPFVDQTGTSLPNPFPFVPPPPGTPVDFTPYLPIIQFGELLPSLRSQYVEQYNTALEYQISRSIVFGAAYVGSQGHHLLASYDTNHGNPGLCLQINADLGPDTCGPGGEDSTYQLPSGQTIYGTRPFGAFANNGLPSDSGGSEAFVDAIAIDSISQSSYNSAQFHLQGRTKALQFLASYTFSKSIDNASGFQDLLNPYCYKCDLGLSAFDTRHHFVFSYTYELPLKRFAPSGLRQKLIDGWEIGGIYTYQSGNPIFLRDTADDNSLQGTFDAFAPPDRPDLVAPVHKLDARRTVCAPGTGGAGEPQCDPINPGFDVSSFTVNALGTVGNARHSFFSGSPLNNLDFTLIKRTSFGERYALEFRTEVFNLLNHPQLFNPVGNFAARKFGDVLGARDPRFIQFGLKLDF